MFPLTGGEVGRLMRAILAAAVAALTISMTGLTTAGPAHADVVPYVPWSSYLAGWTDAYVPSSYYDWAAGNRSAVPQAWLTALDAAQSKRVTGTGDLLLGMNAHINRDLPYVMAAVGLVAPDGSSRKPDYDAVEAWLYDATAPLIA